MTLSRDSDVLVEPARVEEVEANLQALALRQEGLTYSSIAIVMRVYHGVTLAPSTWRHRCRNMGAAPKWHCSTLPPREVCDA